MPSAIFLLMMDEAMSGMLSTVPVTSRSAYSFLSAGAISGVCPTNTQPIRSQRREERVPVHGDAEAGNRLQLVDRAARVAETAAGALRHHNPAGRDERRDDDRGLVADAAGAVLACLDARDAGEIDAVPGGDHRSVSHAVSSCTHVAQQHGHQQGRGLIVGDGART